MKGIKRYSVCVEWFSWPMQYEPRTHRQTLVFSEKTTMGETIEWLHQWNPDANITDLKFSDVGAWDDGGL